MHASCRSQNGVPMRVIVINDGHLYISYGRQTRRQRCVICPSDSRGRHVTFIPENQLVRNRLTCRIVGSYGNAGKPARHRFSPRPSDSGPCGGAAPRFASPSDNRCAEIPRRRIKSATGIPSSTWLQRRDNLLHRKALPLHDKLLGLHRGGLPEKLILTMVRITHSGSVLKMGFPTLPLCDSNDSYRLSQGETIDVPGLFKEAL